MMIDIQAYYDIDFFKKAALSFLETQEIENNVALGILLDKNSSSLQPIHMSMIRKDGEPIAVLLQTHPKQVLVSAKAGLEEEDLLLAGKRIAQVYRSVPGLLGEKTVTETLAKRIASLTGKRAYTAIEQRLHKLTEIEKTGNPGTGKKVLLTSEHRPLISQWVFDFCQEVNEQATMFEADEKADEMIRKKSLYGWADEGEIVSMANWSRPTKTNVNINYVYTPPAHRKKGYATECVMELTEQMLASGFETVSLFTDQANPTANKIYAEIGYKPVQDFAKILFEEKPKKPAGS
ncbi:GNAT family N-acetyltransferase [Bacillus sp. FJAT-42376]|uniref:GNAT family N-acetyltransferase n=1 Tax=Bacillus sp. FJAT-42376 TaxID=2014076 RepID=UPI000F4EA98A|nr:GNAT family N-acetyltransferase [Bacillus sp. FJAT-42376]AZB42666.1 GNAT family N-acetyltransferase [Bacillus sp. FJAT-42376]